MMVAIISTLLVGALGIALAAMSPVVSMDAPWKKASLINLGMLLTMVAFGVALLGWASVF